MTNPEYLRNSKDYYNTRFGTNDEKSKLLTEDEQVRWSVIAESLQKYIKNSGKTEITILDFGCGRGWLSNLLSSYGKVTGVDLAEDAISFAKKQYPGINFICLDASSRGIQNLEGKKFDIAVSSEVIEHVTDQHSYMQNLSEFIKNDGILILTTPNGEWYDEWFTGERNTFRQPYELWLTSGKLQELGLKYFKSVSICSFNPDWLFFHKSNVSQKLFTSKVTYKIANLLGFYNSWRNSLNRKNYGLYLILNAYRS